MTAVWIPPMDRSKFMSNMMASALGAAVAMPVCGFMISWFGWPSVFYLTGLWFPNEVLMKLLTIDAFTGGIGVIWSLCWFFFIFETPSKHPRISDAERKEIEDAIGRLPEPSKLPYLTPSFASIRIVDIEETSLICSMAFNYKRALRMGYHCCPHRKCLWLLPSR